MKITRRDFIRTMGLGVAATGIGSVVGMSPAQAAAASKVDLAVCRAAGGAGSQSAQAPAGAQFHRSAGCRGPGGQRSHGASHPA